MRQLREVWLRPLVGLWLFLMVLSEAGAPPLTADMRADLSALASSIAGIYVVDLATGEEVTAQNVDRAYIPASITKAVTTASLLSLRDSNDVFVTPVWMMGESVMRDGKQTLDGDLVIQVVGDPTLESERFQQRRGIADSIASALVRKGVERVRGRVLIDGSRFVDATVPEGWEASDLSKAYGAPLYGATYRHNLTAGSRGGQVVDNRPDTTLVRDVANALRARNVQLDWEELPWRENGEVLYMHRSARVVDIMRDLMVRSDNLFAEGMLRLLATEESRDAALAEEMELWNDAETCTNTRGVRLYDGSGLSRSNRITPRFMADVLSWMMTTSVAPSYLRLFPRAGREGTVRGLLKGTALEGRMALKSGSMSGVQCFAGYALDDEGRATHAVVVMVNGFRQSRSRLRSDIERTLLNIFRTGENNSSGPDEESEPEE